MTIGALKKSLRLPKELPRFVPNERYTVEQYLAIEASTGRRYEFHDGHLISVEAMGGGSFLHSVLQSNISYSVLKAFDLAPERHQSCAMCSSDLRIAVNNGERYIYPDAAIVCGKPQYDDTIPSAIINPVVVFEVPSPSSEVYNRGIKFDFYDTFESLREYVIIDQDRQRIEVRHRETAQAPWRYTVVSLPHEHVTLPSLTVDLTVSEIYRNWAQLSEENGTQALS